jgi:hypothetical protein
VNAARCILLLLYAAVSFETAAAQDEVARKFLALDVYLQADEPVAAWQFEFSGQNSKIVGVENGESGAYDGAPYYDREAVQRGTADRVVVADFSLAAPEALPSGRVRIATLHLILEDAGPPEFDLDLVTAVTPDGAAIDASIALKPRRGSQQ